MFDVWCQCCGKRVSSAPLSFVDACLLARDMRQSGFRPDVRVAVRSCVVPKPKLSPWEWFWLKLRIVARPRRRRAK